MTRVLLGKDTETGEFFESSDFTEVEDFTGVVVLADLGDGEVGEVTGTEDGQVLVWSTATSSWTVSTETVATNRRLLEEILMVLLDLRDRAPTPWFVSKIAELEMILKEQVQ